MTGSGAISLKNISHPQRDDFVTHNMCVIMVTSSCLHFYDETVAHQ